jgi:hypothetical protein
MSLFSSLKPSNLRIGTKLAVTSGLAIVLVAAIVSLQWLSGRDIRESTGVSRLQVGVFSDALSAQAALRGMQIGVRDIRLAASKDALQTATNRMEELAKVAHGFVDPLAQKVSILRIKLALPKSAVWSINTRPAPRKSQGFRPVSWT